MSAQLPDGYELFGGAEGLAAVSAEWEALESRTGCHLFQTCSYARLWQEKVGTPSHSRPIVIALRERGKVVGLLPLCRTSAGGIPVLTWLGGPSLLDYGDALFDRASSTTPAGQFVATALELARDRDRSSLLYLPNVREDAVALEALRTRLRVLKRGAAPYVTIEGDFDGYFCSLGKNLRRTVLRGTRHLSELGELEFELFGPADQQAEPTIRRLLSLHLTRFGRRRTRSPLADARNAELRVAQATRDPHGLVGSLTLDGTVIAASFNPVYRNRMYCLMTAFDERYAEHSPGVILHMHMIRSCFERGWDPCDFCWGGEPYKYFWTDRDVPLTTFVSEGPAGALASLMASWRRAAAGKRDPLAIQRASG